MLKSTLLKRAVSLSLSTVFLFFSVYVPDAAYAQAGVNTPVGLAQAPVYLIDNIRIPDENGSIKESHQGTNGKFIIHIQDAHVNYEGQKNLSVILKNLIEHYGIELVLVEGGAGDVGLSFLRNFSTKKKRERIADKYLKKGKIAGEEYLDIISDPGLNFSIYGIEDKHLYDTNLKQFLKVDKFRDEAAEFADSVNKSLDILKDKLYSDGLKEFDKLKSAYEETELDIVSYCRYLIELLNRPPGSISIEVEKLLNVDRLEKGIDFDVVTSERDDYISILSERLTEDRLQIFLKEDVDFKSGLISSKEFYTYLKEVGDEAGIDITQYPNLHIYTYYIKALSDIDQNRLFDEIRDLEDRTGQALCENDTQKTIRKTAERLALIKRFVNLQLAPDDLSEYESDKKEFDLRKWVNFINKTAKEYNLNEALIDYNPVINKNLRKLESFYRIAERRDRAFFNNAVKVMRQNGRERAAIITGGFHTERLMPLFKDKGFSYAVVTPKIVKRTDYSLYRSLLKNELSLEEKVMEAVFDSLRGAALLDPSRQAALEVILREIIFERGFLQSELISQPLADIVIAMCQTAPDNIITAGIRAVEDVDVDTQKITVLLNDGTRRTFFMDKLSWEESATDSSGAAPEADRTSFGNVTEKEHRIKSGLNDLVERLFVDKREVGLDGDKSEQVLKNRINRVLAGLRYKELTDAQKEALGITVIDRILPKAVIDILRAIGFSNLLFSLRMRRVKKRLNIHFLENPRRCLFWARGKYAAGHYGRRRISIYISAGYAQDANPDQVFEVALHEALHLLGFNHKCAKEITRQLSVDHGAQRLMDRMARDEITREMIDEIEKGLTVDDLKAMEDMFRDYDYRTLAGEVSMPFTFLLMLALSKMALERADELGIPEEERIVLLARDCRELEAENGIKHAAEAALRYCGLSVIDIAKEFPRGTNSVSSYSSAIQWYNPLMGIFLTASHMRQIGVSGFKVVMRDESGEPQSIPTSDIKRRSYEIIHGILSDISEIKRLRARERGTYRVDKNADEYLLKVATLIGRVAARTRKKPGSPTLYDLGKELDEDKGKTREVLERWEAPGFADTKPLKDLSIVVEGANTPSGHQVEVVLEALGAEVTVLNKEIRGLSGKHGADPSDDANLVEVKQAVFSKRYDFGLAFDLDGDRCAIIVPDKDAEDYTELESLPLDVLTALLLPFLTTRCGYNPEVLEKKERKKVAVIRDVLGTEMVDRVANKTFLGSEMALELAERTLGIEVYPTDAGYVYLKAKRKDLKQHNYVVPVYGESSGHGWLDITGPIENPIAIIALFGVMINEEKARYPQDTIKNKIKESMVIPYKRSGRFDPLFHEQLLKTLSSDIERKARFKVHDWEYRRGEKIPQKVIAMGKDYVIEKIGEYFKEGATFTVSGAINGELKVLDLNLYWDDDEELFRYADIRFSLNGEYIGRYIFRASSNDPNFVCGFEVPEIDYETGSRKGLKDVALHYNLIGGLVLNWLSQRKYVPMQKKFKNRVNVIEAFDSVDLSVDERLIELKEHGTPTQPSGATPATETERIEAEGVGYVVGVDLGGTKIGAGLVDKQGRLIQRADDVIIPKQRENYEGITADSVDVDQVLDTIFRQIRGVIDSSGVRPEEIRAVGIGSPGIIQEDGLIELIYNLPLTGINVKQEMERRLEGHYGLKMPTFIINDMGAGALGEAFYGTGRDLDLRRFLFGTISTGTNAARFEAEGLKITNLEVGGREVSPGRKLEDLTSGPNIARIARERIQAGRQSLILELAGGEIEKITSVEVGRAANRGDELALEILREVGAHYGREIVKLAIEHKRLGWDEMFFVLGGGVTRIGEPLKKAFEDGIAKAKREAEEPFAEPRLVISEHVERKILGAAAFGNLQTMADEGGEESTEPAGAAPAVADWAEDEKAFARGLIKKYFTQYLKMLGLDENITGRLRIVFAYRSDEEPPYYFLVTSHIAYHLDPVFAINTRDCTFEEFKELSSSILTNMCAQLFILSDRVVEDRGRKERCAGVTPTFEFDDRYTEVKINDTEGGTIDISFDGETFFNIEQLTAEKERLRYDALSDTLAMNWIDRDLYDEGKNHQITNLMLKIKGDLRKLRLDLERARVSMERLIEGELQGLEEFRAGTLLPCLARYEAVLEEQIILYPNEGDPQVRQGLVDLRASFRSLALEMIEKDGHIEPQDRKFAVNAYENLVGAFRYFFIGMRFELERQEDLKLSVEVVGNPHEALVFAAREAANLMMAKPDAKIGLATGQTMRGFYEILADYINILKIDLSKVRFYNLDEYYPNPEVSFGGYHRYMEEVFFGRIDKKNRPQIVEAKVVEDETGVKRVEIAREGNAYIPGTTAEGQDLEVYCRWFDEEVDSDGGLDLQFLGIGRGDRAYKYTKGGSVEAALELLYEYPEAMTGDEEELSKWRDSKRDISKGVFIKEIISSITDKTKDKEGRGKLARAFDDFCEENREGIDRFLAAFNKRHGLVEGGIRLEDIKEAMLEGIGRLQPRFLETGGHIGFNEAISGRLYEAAVRFAEVYFAPELLAKTGEDLAKDKRDLMVELRSETLGEKEFRRTVIEPLFMQISQDVFGRYCARISDAKIEEWLDNFNREVPPSGTERPITFEQLREALTIFYTDTRKVVLSQTTRMANAGDFSSGGVPACAVSRGIRGIISSGRIVLLAFGDEKRDVIREAVAGEITPRIPASVLQRDKDKVRVIVDSEAGRDIIDDPYKFSPQEKRDHAVITTVDKLSGEGEELSAQSLTLEHVKRTVKRKGIVALFEEVGFVFKEYIKGFLERFKAKVIKSDDYPSNTIVIATQPHPDDFVICAAGLGRILVERGNRVEVLTATCGYNAVWDYFVTLRIRGIDIRGDIAAWILSQIERQGYEGNLLQAGLDRFNEEKPFSALVERIENGELAEGELEVGKKPLTDDDIEKIRALKGILESEDLSLGEYETIGNELWDKKLKVRRDEDVASCGILGIPEGRVTLLDLPFYKTRNRGIRDLSDEDHRLARDTLERILTENGILADSPEEREKRIIDLLRPHIKKNFFDDPNNRKAAIAILDGIYQGKDNRALMAIVRREYGFDQSSFDEVIKDIKRSGLLEPAILMISDDIDPRGTHGLVQELIKMHFRNIMSEKKLVRPVASVYYHGAWDEYPLAYGLARCVEFDEEINNTKQKTIKAHESQLIAKYPGEDERPFWERALVRNTLADESFRNVVGGKKETTRKYMEVIKILVTLPTQQDKDLPPPDTLQGLVFRPIESPQSTVRETAWAALGTGIAAAACVPFAIFGIVPAVVPLSLAATSAVLFAHAIIGQKPLSELTPKQARAPNIFTDTTEIAHYASFGNWLKDVKDAFSSFQSNRLFGLITHEPFHALSRSNLFAYSMQAVSLGFIFAGLSYLVDPSGIGLLTLFAAAIEAGGRHGDYADYVRDYLTRNKDKTLVVFLDLDKTLSIGSKEPIDDNLRDIIAKILSLNSVYLVILSQRSREEISARVLKPLEETGISSTHPFLISMPDTGIDLLPDEVPTPDTLEEFADAARQYLRDEGIPIDKEVVVEKGKKYHFDETANYIVTIPGVKVVAALYGTVLVDRKDIRPALIDFLRERGINGFIGGRGSVDIMTTSKADAAGRFVDNLCRKLSLPKEQIAAIALDDEYKPYAAGRPLLEWTVENFGLAISPVGIDLPGNAGETAPAGCILVASTGPSATQTVLSAIADTLPRPTEPAGAAPGEAIVARSKEDMPGVLLEIMQETNPDATEGDARDCLKRLKTLNRPQGDFIGGTFTYVEGVPIWFAVYGSYGDFELAVINVAKEEILVSGIHIDDPKAYSYSNGYLYARSENEDYAFRVRPGGVESSPQYPWPLTLNIRRTYGRHTDASGAAPVVYEETIELIIGAGKNLHTFGDGYSILLEEIRQADGIAEARFGISFIGMDVLMPEYSMSQRWFKKDDVASTPEDVGMYLEAEVLKIDPEKNLVRLKVTKHSWSQKGPAASQKTTQDETGASGAAPVVTASIFSDDDKRRIKEVLRESMIRPYVTANGTPVTKPAPLTSFKEMSGEIGRIEIRGIEDLISIAVRAARARYTIRAYHTAGNTRSYVVAPIPADVVYDYIRYQDCWTAVKAGSSSYQGDLSDYRQACGELRELAERYGTAGEMRDAYRAKKKHEGDTYMIVTQTLRALPKDMPSEELLRRMRLQIVGDNVVKGGVSVAISLGGTKVACALLDVEGNVCVIDEAPTPKESAEACFDKIWSQIETATRCVGARNVVKVGIASPGPIDLVKGQVLATENTPLGNFYLRDAARNRFKEVFGIDVTTELIHDGMAAVLGEASMRGTLPRCANLVFIIWGTGIGNGIIRNARPYLEDEEPDGVGGMVGEIGHLVIRLPDGTYEYRVCKEYPQDLAPGEVNLENYIAGPALIRRMRQQIGEADAAMRNELLDLSGRQSVSDLELVTINTAARKGSQLALGMIREAGREFGRGLAPFVRYWRDRDEDFASRLVIGSGVAKIGNGLTEGPDGEQEPVLPKAINAGLGESLEPGEAALPEVHISRIDYEREFLAFVPDALPHLRAATEPSGAAPTRTIPAMVGGLSRVVCQELGYTMRTTAEFKNASDEVRDNYKRRLLNTEFMTRIYRMLEERFTTLAETEEQEENGDSTLALTEYNRHLSDYERVQALAAVAFEMTKPQIGHKLVTHRIPRQLYRLDGKLWRETVKSINDRAGMDVYKLNYDLNLETLDTSSAENLARDLLKQLNGSDKGDTILYLPLRIIEMLHKDRENPNVGELLDRATLISYDDHGSISNRFIVPEGMLAWGDIWRRIRCERDINSYFNAARRLYSALTGGKALLRENVEIVFSDPYECLLRVFIDFPKIDPELQKWINDHGHDRLAVIELELAV